MYVEAGGRHCPVEGDGVASAHVEGRDVVRSRNLGRLPVGGDSRVAVDRILPVEGHCPGFQRAGADKEENDEWHRDQPMDGTSEARARRHEIEPPKWLEVDDFPIRP